MTYPTTRVHVAIIKPEDIIEAWSLCPHIATFIKQINLLRCKTVEWNLLLELELFQDRVAKCCNSLSKTRSYTSEDVINDWQLSFHLREALFNIRAYQEIQHKNENLDSLKGEILQQALSHISAEVGEVLSQ
jgi:hypothetical protein